MSRRVEPEFISRAGAAELADVNVRTVDRWADEGLITRYKVGGLQWVQFKTEEILAMREPVPTDTPAEGIALAGRPGE